MWMMLLHLHVNQKSDYNDMTWLGLKGHLPISISIFVESSLSDIKTFNI